jgi:hypothetical protein
MLHRNSRRVRSLGPLFLGALSSIMCTVLCVSTWVSFNTPPFSTEPLTFPTRLPCTPVPDPLNPPIYPKAQHVAVTPNPNRYWLEMMNATSFDTPDDADTVLDYYRAKMVADGWFLEFELSKALQTPATKDPYGNTFGYLDYEVAKMPDVKDVQGYAAFCNTTSAHPIRVVVVVRTLVDGRTQVQLRVY